MKADEYVQRLTEISVKKKGLMEEMLAATREQAQIITEDGIDQLQRLIDLKQEKIDAINKLDEDFNVYFQRLKKELGVKNLAEAGKTGIKEVNELQWCVQSIMEITREISKLEKENNEKAKNLLDKLGNEIKKLNQGKKMSSVYNPGVSVQPPSYFIDSKK